MNTNIRLEHKFGGESSSICNIINIDSEGLIIEGAGIEGSVYSYLGQFRDFSIDGNNISCIVSLQKNKAGSNCDFQKWKIETEKVDMLKLYVSSTEELGYRYFPQLKQAANKQGIVLSDNLLKAVFTKAEQALFVDYNAAKEVE